MEFQVLIEKTLREPQLKRQICKLIERKKSGEELDFGPRIPSISGFVESEIKRLEGYHPEKVKYDDFSELDIIFKKIVTK
jgi:predicted nucleotidyltransferase